MAYLAWRYNGFCYAKIEIQELEDDGLSFKAGPQPIVLLSSEAGDDFSIEAPFIIYRFVM